MAKDERHLQADIQCWEKTACTPQWGFKGRKDSKRNNQKTAHRPCWRINEGQFGEGYARTAMVSWKNDASSYASLSKRGYIQWQINGKVVGDNSYGVSANQIAMAVSTRNVVDVMIGRRRRWNGDWQRTGRKAEGSERIIHKFLGNSQRNLTNALLRPFLFETFFRQNHGKNIDVGYTFYNTLLINSS